MGGSGEVTVKVPARTADGDIETVGGKGHSVVMGLPTKVRVGEGAKEVGLTKHYRIVAELEAGTGIVKRSPLLHIRVTPLADHEVAPGPPDVPPPTAKAPVPGARRSKGYYGPRVVPGTLIPEDMGLLKDDSMREAPLVREFADTTLKKRSEWAVYDDPNVYGGGA